MNYIRHEKIEHMKRTLKNYYYLKGEEQKTLMDALLLEMKLDDEGVKGQSYENKSSGCSASYPKGSYSEYLAKEIATYDLEAKRLKKEYTTLDKCNWIEKRLSMIADSDRALIYSVFNQCESYGVVGKRLGIKTQTVSDKVRSAIIALLEVEV